jgi:hypothetical protein
MAIAVQIDTGWLRTLDALHARASMGLLRYDISGAERSVSQGTEGSVSDH